MATHDLIKRLAKLEAMAQSDDQQVSRIELVAICPKTHQPVGQPVCIFDRRKAGRSA